MDENREPLDSLLEEITVKEKKFKRRFYYSLALPTIIALVLIVVFSNQINEARKEISALNREKDTLANTIVELDSTIADQKKRLGTLEEQITNLTDAQAALVLKLVQRLNWKKTDVLGNDATKIENSQKAVEEIKNLFKTHIKEINKEKLVITYFVKRLDNNKVENVIDKCAIKQRYFNPDKFKSPTPTNKISFGNKITLSEVKLIAYMLFWAGLDIKKLEELPNKPINSRAVIISGDDDLRDSEPITLETIVKATSLEEIVTPSSS